MTKMQALVAGGDQPGERRQDTEVAVPISLEFNPLSIGYNDLVEFLRSVVDIVEALRGRDLQRQTTTTAQECATCDVSQSGGGEACSIAFKLEAVKLHLYSFEITSEVAGNLTTLVQLGVTISNLVIRLRKRDIWDGWCSRAAQGALFQALPGVPQEAPPTSSAVDCITIRGSNVGADQIAALGSALALSKHVSTLNFFSVLDDASAANRVAKWRWLAYALFSCDSMISVDKLDINGQEMLLGDVEAMVAVIESLSPVQELAPSVPARPTTPASTPTVDVGSIAHLTKGTIVRLASIYEEKRCKISTLCVFEFAPSGNTTELLRLVCDPTSAAAQTIRHLKLIPESLRAFEASTLTVILDMLEANMVLESLQLRIPSTLYESFAPELTRFYGQSLPVVKAALPLQSRLALLSVVQIMSKTSTDSKSDSEDPQSPHKKARLAARGVNLQRLDSDVISLIFLFAAERPTREIEIQSL